MSQNLEKIDFFMREFIAEFDCDEALKMFDELSSGKKLRSKLLLNIAGINENSLKLCAIIELIQAASLLHDDVIDESFWFPSDTPDALNELPDLDSSENKIDSNNFFANNNSMPDLNFPDLKMDNNEEAK